MVGTYAFWDLFESEEDYTFLKQVSWNNTQHGQNVFNNRPELEMHVRPKYHYMDEFRFPNDTDMNVYFHVMTPENTYHRTIVGYDMLPTHVHITGFVVRAIYIGNGKGKQNSLVQ